jgi:sialate O-acetylesterase
MCAGLFSSSRASVRLPEVLGDHMVLQQNTVVTLWGWSSVGNEIDVTTSWGEKATAHAAPDGAWNVQIKTPAAQPLSKGLHPETITIAMPGENVIQIRDVLIGEVWLCSGQSNMEMMLQSCYPPGWSGWYGEAHWKEESKKADRPYLRDFEVEKTAAQAPQTDVKGILPSKGLYAPDAAGFLPEPRRGWQVCTPETAGYFSAVAYYFGSMLAEKLQVPVGLITTDVGGTPIEDWGSGGKYYNGMIAPFFPMTLRGAIWYQGESNVGESPGVYASLFSAMIRDWRKNFHEDDLPFYFVQIAPYANGSGDGSARLREEQASALALKNTGMVVTNDVGDPNNIHPKDKRDVGWRLASQALRKTYGQTDAIADGPTFDSLLLQDGKIHVRFHDVGGGLTSRDGQPLTCFTVVGVDGKSASAPAEIAGDEVVISSPVPNPAEVRFAWGASDQPNLMSKDGLPAAQFRAPVK